MNPFAPVPPLPPSPGQYRVIYADPPWPEYGGGKITRGAQKHYPLMKVEEICALPVGEWAAADAHCYCWTTNNYLQAGLDVVKAWGFRYVTCITWVKSKPGLGQYYRGMTEHCLFAVRGRLPYRQREDGKRAQGRTVVFDDDASLLDLPAAFEATAEAHSVKPERMRHYIELVSGHGLLLELFARQRVEGWDAWGNEA